MFFSCRNKNAAFSSESELLNRKTIILLVHDCGAYGSTYTQAVSACHVCNQTERSVLALTNQKFESTFN